MYNSDSFNRQACAILFLFQWGTVGKHWFDGLSGCQAWVSWCDVFLLFVKMKGLIICQMAKENQQLSVQLFTSTFPMCNLSWPYGGAVAALLCSVQVFSLCELPFGFTTLAQEMNSRSSMRDCVCLISLCGNFVYICVSSLEHLRWQGKVTLLLRKQVCVRSAPSPQTSIFLRSTRLCEGGTCS